MSANENPAHLRSPTRTLPTSPVRETYQLPTHPGLRVSDADRPKSIGSIGSNGPRTSIFLEHSEDLEPQPMPTQWNRDSQSAYRTSRNFSHPRRAGQSNLSISTYGTSEGGAKSPSPTTFVYEMPERYRGKGIQHDDYVGHPLASDMNTWAPPPPEEKTLCGLPRKRMLWVLVGIICLLVLVGVIGGVVGGISAMNKSSKRLVIALYC